jgi:DNA-binding NtrC family response regulator
MLVLTVRTPSEELRFPLAEPLVVGRSPECGAVVIARGISRTHFRAGPAEGGGRVEELGSKNGVFVDGVKVDGAAFVPIGREFWAGEALFRFEESPTDDLRPARELHPRGRPREESAITDVGAEPERRLDPRLAAAWIALAAERESSPESKLARLVDGLVGARVASRAFVVGREKGGEFHLAECERALQAEPRRDRGGPPAPVGAEQAIEGGRLALMLSGGPGIGDAKEPLARLLLSIDREWENRLPEGAPAAKGEARREAPLDGIVAPPGSLFAGILDEASRIASSKLPVLLLGPTGTGKEIVARFLHRSSPRATGPFVALNCAALSPDLLDLELFGIEDRVATQVAERRGKFELASGGTLLLDEIADMAPETQARILRTLQEGELFRIGGTASRRVDVRVVAATNRDLRKEIDAGRFRQDLWFRLSAVTIRIPPLASRRDEIAPLVHARLEALAAETGKPIRGISVRALRALAAHDWPGNVRELFAEIERLFHLADPGGLIDCRSIRPELREEEDAIDAEVRRGGTFAESVARLERRLLEEAMAKSGGNLSATAKLLGMPRTNLLRQLEAHGLRKG